MDERKKDVTGLEISLGLGHSLGFGGSLGLGHSLSLSGHLFKLSSGGVSSHNGKLFDLNFDLASRALFFTILS